MIPIAITSQKKLDKKMSLFDKNNINLFGLVNTISPIFTNKNHNYYAA